MRAGTDDWAIWATAVGADGYSRFWLRRGDIRIMVRANRYALAAALDGAALVAVGARDPRLQQSGVCPREFSAETGLLHVLPGMQRDNMVMVARGRGGGRVAVRRGHNGVRRGGCARWRCTRRSAMAGMPRRRELRWWARRNRPCGNVPAPPGGNRHGGGAHAIRRRDESVRRGVEDTWRAVSGTADRGS